jgi:hypothetical protein
VDRNLFFLRARLALGQNDRCKEEFEDTKGLNRIRISKKNKQHNGQKKNIERNSMDSKISFF